VTYKNVLTYNLQTMLKQLNQLLAIYMPTSALQTLPCPKFLPRVIQYANSRLLSIFVIQHCSSIKIFLKI
jgi:hypothetical protein